MTEMLSEPYLRNMSTSKISSNAVVDMSLKQVFLKSLIHGIQVKLHF